MQNFSFYKILGIILMPVAVLFAIFTAMMLVIGLAAPPLLLAAFILGSIVIYIYTSNRFFYKGILNAKPCKHQLRDWIRVNAFVSIFFCAWCLLDVVTILFKPALIEQLANQIISTQQTNLPPGFTATTFVSFAKGLFWFLGFVSITLLMHIFMSFRLMKSYQHVFDEQ